MDGHDDHPGTREHSLVPPSAAAPDLGFTVDELALTLAEVDVDGALRETAEAAFPQSRRRLLGTAAGFAALLGLAGAPGAGAADARTRNDIDILRFDLVLEYLQAALYTEAQRLGAVEPRTRDFARVVGAHERAHVVAIKQLLGRRYTVASPSFDFRDVTQDDGKFTKTAVAFEDLTAALLKWQAVRLDSRSVVAAVVTLHSVETRHAAWMRHIVGAKPAASAFDQPASQRRMTRLIASTRFQTSKPKTGRRGRSPRFTG